jgi:type II secretory pathway pseudopilin PulG
MVTSGRGTVRIDGARRHGEAGYNLVILVVAITVMNILVAAAIPLWRTAIRREKEEELIFRGIQYAEAIRVFHARQGRLPTRLAELMETHPRCIRQLWLDPITGKNDWVPIRVGLPGGEGQPSPPDGQPQVDGEGRPVPSGTAGASTPDGSVGLGAIRGVRSRSKEKSIKILFGQQQYDQWQFTVESLSQGGPITGIGPTGEAHGPALSVRWLGRPFRPGLMPGGMTPPPQGTPPLGGPTNPPPKPQPSPADEL